MICKKSVIVRICQCEDYSSCGPLFSKFRQEAAPFDVGLEAWSGLLKFAAECLKRLSAEMEHV
jgi:hypothetical protein